MKNFIFIVSCALLITSCGAGNIFKNKKNSKKAEPEKTAQALFPYQNVIDGWDFSLPLKEEPFSVSGDDQMQIWSINKYLTVDTNNGTAVNYVVWFSTYTCTSKDVDWDGYTRLAESDSKGDALMYAPHPYEDFLGNKFQNHTFLYTKDDKCLLIEFRQENSDGQIINPNDGSEGFKVILEIAKSVKNQK